MSNEAKKPDSSDLKPEPSTPPIKDCELRIAKYKSKAPVRQEEAASAVATVENPDIPAGAVEVSYEINIKSRDGSVVQIPKQSTLILGALNKETAYRAMTRIMAIFRTIPPEVITAYHQFYANQFGPEKDESKGYSSEAQLIDLPTNQGFAYTGSSIIPVMPPEEEEGEHS